VCTPVRAMSSRVGEALVPKPSFGWQYPFTFFAQRALPPFFFFPLVWGTSRQDDNTLFEVVKLRIQGKTIPSSPNLAMHLFFEKGRHITFLSSRENERPQAPASSRFPFRKRLPLVRRSHFFSLQRKVDPFGTVSQQSHFFGAVSLFRHLTTFEFQKRRTSFLLSGTPERNVRWTGRSLAGIWASDAFSPNPTRAASQHRLISPSREPEARRVGSSRTTTRYHQPAQ